MPKPKRYQQQSVASIGTWDNSRVVDSIVDQAEAGDFYNAALLVDQILRDDRIRGVLMTRVYGLLGKPLELEPARDIAKARKVAEEIDEDWAQLFPHDAIAELLTWGLLLGVGVAQIISEKVGTEWKTRLEVWHPQHLRYDDELGQYFLRPKGMEEIPIDPGDGQWVLYTPYGFRNPGRRGLLRSLAHLYLERQWARRDRSRYSEIHGQPLRVGIAPANAKDDAVTKYGDDLSPTGAEPVVVVRQGEEGNRWDLKLIEANGKSDHLFDTEIRELDKAAAVLVLGQSQSTDGQAGLGANENAGEHVRVDLMRQDSDSLGMTLQQQVLTAYCEFHYGAADLAPLPCWDVDPPEDMTQKAQELKTLAEALSLFKTMGAPVDMRAVLEEHKVPMLTEAEAANLEKEAADMATEAAKAVQQTPKNGAATAKPTTNASAGA